MKTSKRCPSHDGGKGRILPISQFHNDRNALDGHQSRCKVCKNSERRAIYVRQGASLRDLYATLRGHACRQGAPFDLSYEDYVQLVAQPCAYGGGLRPVLNIGVDRKDPKGGYTLANLVACCWRHNSIKSDLFTFESMVRIVNEFQEARECGDLMRKRKRKYVRSALVV